MTLVVAEGVRCFVNQGFSWNWADGKLWKLVQNLARRLVPHVGVGLFGFKFDNVISTLLSRYLQDYSIVRQVKATDFQETKGIKYVAMILET